MDEYLINPRQFSKIMEIINFNLRFGIDIYGGLTKKLKYFLTINYDGCIMKSQQLTLFDQYDLFAHMRNLLLGQLFRLKNKYKCVRSQPKRVELLEEYRYVNNLYHILCRLIGTYCFVESDLPF